MFKHIRYVTRTVAKQVDGIPLKMHFLLHHKFGIVNKFKDVNKECGINSNPIQKLALPKVRFVFVGHRQVEANWRHLAKSVLYISVSTPISFYTHWRFS